MLCKPLNRMLGGWLTTLGPISTPRGSPSISQNSTSDSHDHSRRGPLRETGLRRVWSLCCGKRKSRSAVSERTAMTISFPTPTPLCVPSVAFWCPEDQHSPHPLSYILGVSGDKLCLLLRNWIVTVTGERHAMLSRGGYRTSFL